MFSKIKHTTLLKKQLQEVTKNNQNHHIRKITTQEVINREQKYTAHNYHPVPVALCRGEGIVLFNFIEINFN